MLSSRDVHRLAELSRLAIDEADVPRVLDDLNRVLALVDRLSAVDTAGVEPMTHASGTAARLREDEVTAPVGPEGREAAQASAPATADGLYLVPRVVE